MILRKVRHGRGGQARRRGKTRLRLALGLLCLVLLAACGVKVGTSPYVSERNVGPHSQRYQGSAPERQSAPAQHASRYQELVNRPQSAHEATGIIEMARKQIGVPYRYGGSTPSKGFDCSGLIFWVYKQNGVSLPRTAKAQSKFGEPVDKSRLRPGDIVVFRAWGNYHTGIYSGNGYFIHSPKKGDRVREESMEANYWRRGYLGARRVL